MSTRLVAFLGAGCQLLESRQSLLLKPRRGALIGKTRMRTVGSIWFQNGKRTSDGRRSRDIAG
jgi:hypothetical protein